MPIPGYVHSTIQGWEVTKEHAFGRTRVKGYVGTCIRSPIQGWMVGRYVRSITQRARGKVGIVTQLFKGNNVDAFIHMYKGGMTDTYIQPYKARLIHGYKGVGYGEAGE